LVIGVPVSNVAGIGNGARHGVLLKGSEVIHDLSNVDIMIFDKTGTLTVGNPSVSTSKYYMEKPEEVLGYLASIESESSHPLARAVLDEIGQITFSTVENTEVIKGGGIVADVNGHKIAVGNLGLMEEENVKISKKARKDIDQLIKKGNSLVLTAVDGELKVAMGV